MKIQVSRPCLLGTLLPEMCSHSKKLCWRESGLEPKVMVRNEKGECDHHKETPPKNHIEDKSSVLRVGMEDPLRWVLLSSSECSHLLCGCDWWAMAVSVKLREKQNDSSCMLFQNRGLMLEPVPGVLRKDSRESAMSAGVWPRVATVSRSWENSP